jgi:hypothetical protein
LTPDDDERSLGRPVIVLSHRGWHQLFAGDPMVIGRNVRVTGLPYEIVGVMPDGFRGLGIGPPDYWAALALAARFRDDYAGNEAGIPIDVVGRLKPGMSPESATAALTVWASGRTDREAIRGRPTSIRLRPRQGTSPDSAGEALLVFAPIFFAFGLILMIGCANVANLQLARGVSRQRHAALPSRGDFFPSYAVYLPTDPESPGTSLTLRVRGDLEQTRQSLLEGLTRVDPGLGQINHVFDPVAYAGSLLVIVTACVLAASVPALRAARIDPVATLRKD